MKILKIGGSVLTHKNRPREINNENIDRLSRELNEITEPFILVHGLGSIARAYSNLYCNKTIENTSSYLARKIQLDIKEFHYYFVNKLSRSGMNVRSVDIESIFITENGIIDKSYLEIISYYLEKKFIPVIHGGTVCDINKNFVVLSSDNIVQSISQKLKPTKVVWATDVDGVYERDGKSVMKTITRANVDKMLNSEYDRLDFTGGMKSKVNLALDLADGNIDSIIINANVDNLISKAMNDEPIKGTLITK